MNRGNELNNGRRYESGESKGYNDAAIIISGLERIGGNTLRFSFCIFWLFMASGIKNNGKTKKQQFSHYGGITG